uniref:DUF5641 domain-containing protein n=1 Tax=Anopheles albimanus TaxID=7167 RepID=A0A182FNE1_ANOAL
MAAPSAPTTIRIVGFCDASLKAYGCVFYVTFTDSQGKQATRLLCSKARVAPLKAMTLPRLELHAALLLSELYVRIRDAFDSRVKETHWWSDSQVALSWIRSDNTRWDVFVKHRVAKIQLVTATADWRYVPTKLNPADIVSRGISARKLIRPETMTFWLNGPTFLHSGCDEFPESPSSLSTELESMPSAPLFVAIRLTQQFWTRWRSEYLAQLRCAAKWTRRMPNVREGQIVLIGDDNVPVSRWPLGIVIRIYPGPDGAIRVADVKTGSGIYRRNVRLLAPLPIDPMAPATCGAPYDRVIPATCGDPDDRMAPATCGVPDDP